MFLRIIVVLSLLFAMQNVAAGTLSDKISSTYWWCMVMPQKISIFDTANKHAQCKGQGYETLFEASGIENQLLSRPHRWIPTKGKVAIGDNVILVAFKVDNEMIDFFKSKFLDSNTRFPMGLEIDISPLKNNVFRPLGRAVGLNIHDDVGLFQDTPEFDSHPGYGVVIRNPHKLEVGKVYVVAFYAQGASISNPSTMPVIQESGDVRLIFQVSVDTSLLNPMIAAYDNGDHQLNGYANDGNGDGFDYFVVESDGFSNMVVPDHKTICWYAKQGDDIDCFAGNPFQDAVSDAIYGTGRRLGW